MEPEFIPGPIDTKAYMFRLLSPLFYPAQSPLEYTERQLRGILQAGMLPAQACSATAGGLSLKPAESQLCKAEVTGISQPNPREPMCKLRPRVAQDLPKVTQQIPAELALAPRFPPPALSCLFWNLLMSKGDSACPSLYTQNFEVKRLAQGHQQIGKESVLGDLGRTLAPPSHISLLCSVSVVVPRPPLPPQQLVRQLPRVPVWP